MKRSRFTEEQIIGFIKQAQVGMPIKELCRKGGFSDATFSLLNALMTTQSIANYVHFTGDNARFYS